MRRAQQTTLTLLCLLAAFPAGAQVADIEFSGTVSSNMVVVGNKDQVVYQSIGGNADEDETEAVPGFYGAIALNARSTYYGATLSVTRGTSGQAEFSESSLWVSPVDGLMLYAGSGPSDTLSHVDPNADDTFQVPGFTVVVGPEGDGWKAGLALSAPPTAGEIPIVNGILRYQVENLFTFNATAGNSYFKTLDWASASAAWTFAEAATISLGYNGSDFQTKRIQFVDGGLRFPLSNTSAFSTSGAFYLSPWKDWNAKASLAGALNNDSALAFNYTYNSGSWWSHTGQLVYSLTLVPGAAMTTSLQVNGNPTPAVDKPDPTATLALGMSLSFR